MKKSCEHTFYAPAKYMSQCSKCNIKILIWPAESYSQAEFSKMYPLELKTSSIIFNEWNKDD